MSEYDKIFNKFYKRLVLEAVLKSLIFGVIVGSILDFIITVGLYIANYHALWIAIVVGIVAILTSSLIFYFTIAKPNKDDVAKRVDLFGLKERVLTMIQCADDDSYIAQCQRRDAQAHIKKVENSKIKFVFSKISIILVSIFAFLSISTTSLAGASFSGRVPAFNDIIGDPEDEIITYNISYIEEEGGYIDGEIFQIVAKGEDASEVVAVADDGYMFDSWSDGVTSPNRLDTDIESSFEVFAIFIEIEEQEGAEELEDKKFGDGFELGDMDGEIPPHGGGAAGKYEEYNKIIDGNIYYRDVYQEYYDKALKILNEGGTVPEYMRIIIEDYYNVIK